jgi:PAS domain S-box-containing protein
MSRVSGNVEWEGEGGRAPAVELDYIAAPSALIDASGKVVAANTAWTSAGPSQPLLVGLGRNFVEVIASLSMSRRAGEGVRDVVAGRLQTFTLDVASAGDAGTRWFRLLASARAPQGAAIVLVDITDHHVTEETLRESEERFRHMVDSVQDHAMFTLDRTGCVMTWNSGAERIHGYSAAEIVGQPIHRFYPPGEEARVEDELAETARVGRSEYEGWRIRRNGERFWGRVMTTALRDERGELRGFARVTRDLTERRRSEVALRDTEARLSSIIDSAMDAIITIDETQKIVMFNHSAERIFGVKAGVAMGSAIDRFMPERYRNAHSSHVRTFGTTGVTTRGMGRLGTLYGIRSDGKEFPIEASISQADVGGQRFYTVILRDISERRALEDQLRQAQKMEGIGRLAGGVAHDFNNLLTVIFGYIAVTSQSLAPDDKAQAALAHAREAAERAATLTRQLLAFARKQIVSPTVLRFGDVVGSLEPMLRRLIGEDIQLRTVIAPDTGLVRADTGQLEQVVMNLAVNSRDAMPRGGTLAIETANITLDEAYCRTRVGATPGDHVMLAVTDTGTGMSSDVLERLFEPFFTTKGPGKGTGLGLAMCHGVIKQSGGHIAVYSEPGRGTSVKVFLPRVTNGAEAAAAATPPKAVGGSETVLLVEDNTMVRQLVAEGLRSSGYNVLMAEDGADAVRLAEQDSQRIDLLITDVVMPEMSGVQVAEAIRARRPRLCVIYMSGYTEETIVHHGVETQDMAFIAKPFTVDALLRKVRTVLDTNHKKKR